MDFSEDFGTGDFLSVRNEFSGEESVYSDFYFNPDYDIYDESGLKQLDDAKIDLFGNKNSVTWESFSDLLRKREIKVLKNPKQGWFFTKNYTLKENIEYTFKKYYEALQKVRIEENRRDYLEELEYAQPSYSDKNLKNFLKNPKYKKFWDNLEKYFPEYFSPDNDSYYIDFFETKNHKKSYDNIVEFAKDKYNEKKDNYNFRVENPSYYKEQKEIEKTKRLGKELDEILAFLKPHVLDYRAREQGDFRNLNTKFSDKSKIPDWKQRLKKEDELREQRQKEKQEKLAEERRKHEEILRQNTLAEEKRLTEQLQAAQEEIQDLNYKIIDASGRYALNKGKIKAAEFKLQKLEKLQERKTELTEKLRLKNLSIEERQQILKEKTELNEKLLNIDKVRSQLERLKNLFHPSAEEFQLEKNKLRIELQKYKQLNDASIRQKNALLKSMELEKIKQEIAIREEQRYQEEQRQKEELKQAKIVFLKEKKIVERKLNEINTQNRMKTSRIEELKKVEKDLSYQKKNFEKIKAEKQSALHEKKLQIEQAKLKTLELQKQTLENKTLLAEQQKLFADSIQRDIDDLNNEKNVLKNLTSENKKILENTKREISARQLEIEKNIKLNLETVKQKELKIFSEEAKIKLDVFTTLSDVKEQTAIKLDVENTLEDLKDEIIRKQDVEKLLSDTVDKISNNEISEVENYNDFLDSEIEFKKKLANINLNQKQVLEILTEEKQYYLKFLQETKSSFLQQLLNTKRDIIEKNIKISLIEGKENLSYVTSGMKFEIENLKTQKEISERRKNFAQFQSDNYKRELKLRKQEIEILKNIRLKVLQKERLVARTEAQKAITDIVKTIEKTERDSDVREKLDEILDDVETKEILAKSKATLFSLIDKIENKEIHDAAKEKLDFILGKIELHDNIDESRKTLNNILDKIENDQIRQDVEEKLDEILDDVEYDDYDFLDEDDDLDTFLSNVKKHLSGEKKMEQFSKIDAILQETRQLDSKLKMDENIEMKDLNKKVGPEDYEIGETSFDEFSDYNFFINNIEDPVLKEKTRTFLGNIDNFDKEEEKIPKIKNAYKSAINSALWEDQLDLDYWDGNIILDEKAKFLYEQKVNNINTALAQNDIHIDPSDMRVREFLDIKLVNLTSEKRGEINGYSYNGEKIISRNVKRNFYLNYDKKPAACQRFIDDLKNVINKNARSQIASESFFEKEAVKNCASEYIGELREEQSYQIDSARNATEMRNALREANDIDKEIKNIKKNLPFKMRLKIFKRTLSWKFTKLLRLLWKHKGRTTTILGSLILAGIGLLLNQLGVIAVVHNLKKAARTVHQYANDVQEMGKRIMSSVQSLYRVPGGFLGFNLMIFGVFLRILYYFSFFAGGATSSWVFGILGGVVEISLYFDSNIEVLNEKAANALEETGNVIEKAGIRSQKWISKNMPTWYDKLPPKDRNILQTIEAGAIKAVYKVAEGTQVAGEKVTEAADFMRDSYYYMKIIFILFVVVIILTIIRDLSSIKLL